MRKKCVFTTHTPVPAGHDKFPMDFVLRVLGRREVYDMKEVFCCEGASNLTYLALNLSHYVNSVAKKHDEVSLHMFVNYIIDSTTNGVHAVTWTSGPFQELFDRYISGWRQDNACLRYALSIPKKELWDAHSKMKRRLIQYVNRQTNTGMDADLFTIGFDRCAAAYKRGDLLFQDIGEATGWSIGNEVNDLGETNDRSKDALSLYTKLTEGILPLFYQNHDRFVDIMRNCIAINGSFFNTQRMLQ